MNRWIAIVAVAALFLSGISIGALAVVLLGHHWAESESASGGGPGSGPGMMMRSPMPPPEIFIEHLARQLGLDDDQKAKIQSILAESEERSNEIRREIRPRLEAQIEETHRRIGELLTPDQRRKFEDLRREMHRHSDRFFLGEGPHGPMREPPPADAPREAAPPN
jgi:Spy/CpxP family protein refolding chaperone